MYKTLTVAALLLAVFAFTSGSRSADASPSTPIGPTIVAHGKLLNQTGPIPITTLFTPTQTGLYRLSAYGTTTTADPNSQSTSSYNLFWTDASGFQQTDNGILFSQIDSVAGYWTQGFPAWTLAIQVNAGTPVIYEVTQFPAPDNAVYSLYYTLERLE